MSIKEVNSNVQLTPEMEAELEAWLYQQKTETIEEEEKTTYKLPPEQEAELQEWINEQYRLKHESRWWRRWEGFEPWPTTTPYLDDNWDGPEDLNW